MQQQQTPLKTPKQPVFAFGRTNFILLAVGMAVVIIGMVLMSGSGSGEAPAVCLLGYLFMIYAIVRKPRK